MSKFPTSLAKKILTCWSALLLTSSLAVSASSIQLDAEAKSTLLDDPSVAKAPSSAPVVKVDETDLESSPPKLIHWVVAELTAEGRIAHYQGFCLVSLIVDSKGRPQNVHVPGALGMGLEASAIRAVKQFRFRPATYNGQPIPAKITVEVGFKAS
jgi:TonB family protein